MDAPKARQRLKLNEEEANSPEGAEFISVLAEIYKDRDLTDPKIKLLAGWLNSHRSTQIPGIQRLTVLVDNILVNGVITDVEKMRLSELIYRLLPADKLKHPERSKNDASATERQLAYLKALTGQVHDGLTLEQASAAIEEALESPTAKLSVRQKLLVRFWDIRFTGQMTKAEFSDFLDKAYNENPDRKAAWEMYKQEHGESPDLESIPIGIGDEYLKSLQGFQVRADTLAGRQFQNWGNVEKRTNFPRVLLFGCLGFIIVFGLLMLLATYLNEYY
jgi:hypothetical protein